MSFSFNTLVSSNKTFSAGFVRARASFRKHRSLRIGALVLAVFVLWRVFAAATSTAGIPRYVVAQAEAGTLVVSVTGSGQVSASNQLSLSPQASGQIVYIGVQDGEKVTRGTLIAEVDPTNAEKQVRDAKANLQSAEINLQKVTEPPTALELAQAQDAVSTAENSLVTAYANSTSDLANTFLDLPTIMTGLQDVDFGSETNKIQQWNIDWYENAASKYDLAHAQDLRDSAYAAYTSAKTSYDATFMDFKNVNLASADATTTENILSETYTTLGLVTNAVKASNALIQYYSDQLTANNLTVPSIATTQISSLSSYTSKLSSHSSSLLSDSTSISADKQSINEKQLSLQELQAGATALDLASAQLSVETAQNALKDAQDNLANYYVTAPFDGTVGLSVTPYQQVSSGTTVATLVTSEQLAVLTLNEVDAATVKLGDKATLTFDAFPDLSIAGEVADISPIGTVSQGVVSYTVKIGFSTQDARVKPGMSVNASIDTDVVTNALTVPASAVHTASDGSSYVLVFDPPITASGGAQGTLSEEIPRQTPVTIGASNTTSTQIVAGLSSGDQVVVRATSGSAAAGGASAPSIFGTLGGNRAGGSANGARPAGGAVRIGG